MTETQETETAFEGNFTTSSRPRVLLRMPSCLPLAVNITHSIRFGGPYRVITSEEEYRGAIESHKNPSPLCYCEGIRAIVALEREHCAFELLYDSLRRLPAPDPRRFEVEFLRGPGRRANEPRAYEVYDAHGRLVAPDLLDAALVPIPGLILLITGVPQNGLPPASLQLTLSLGGGNILGQFGSSLRPESFPRYVDTDRELAKALSLCQGDAHRAKEHLLEWVALIPSQDYPQINTLVSGLLRDDPAAQELTRRITGVREYLFDALAVEGTGIRKTLRDRKWSSRRADAQRSTARSLLKHAGTWAGDDLDQCLEDLYASRSPARF